MKVGLYGGSFDPLHFGHLNLAIEVLEKYQLDEIWWIPANRSPLKGLPSTSSSHRAEMVKKGIATIPQFKCLDIELKKEGPSYTIDTVKEILHLHLDKTFYLLVGEDAAAQIVEWKEWGRLVELIPFIVATRSGALLKEKLIHFPENLKKVLHVAMCEIPLFDISSSQVRKRLKEKLYCGHLVPSKVLDYIYQNQLYFNG